MLLTIFLTIYFYNSYFQNNVKLFISDGCDGFQRTSEWKGSIPMEPG